MEATRVTVTIFVRHSADCNAKDKGSQWKRCKCRKSLNIYNSETKKTEMKSCKTRSWDEAEKQAQQVRDQYDPEKLRMQEIEAEDVRRKQARALAEITIADAVKQWIAEKKHTNPSTISKYKTVERKINSWAKHAKLVYMQDVSPAAIAKWKSEWDEDAERAYDRMSLRTQFFFQSYLKDLFSWALGLRMLEINPTLTMRPIKPAHQQTQPLTQAQFQELIDATQHYSVDQLGGRMNRNKHVPQSGAELKALFLLMRYTGLRISDALMLKRSSITRVMVKDKPRNRIQLTTIKNHAEFDYLIGDDVLDALETGTMGNGADKDSYFRAGPVTYNNLSSLWGRSIRAFADKYVSHFVDEKGKPLRFRSHMLRDTFAVELLLAEASIEDVSRWLTHKTIAMTQRYYSPWVQARKEQLLSRAADLMG